MNKSSLELVKEFHEKFGHPIHDRPYLDDEVLNNLRYNLNHEENEELKQALDSKDPIEVFDALCDLQYVLDGAFLSLGFWKIKTEGMNEVQRSNMSKLGSDGKPIKRADGKILKGPNFIEPDFKSIVDKLYNNEPNT